MWSDHYGPTTVAPGAPERSVEVMDILRRATSVAIVETAGLDVVMDRCIEIEHARFHSGLHLADFDTGVILSVRQVTAH